MNDTISSLIIHLYNITPSSLASYGNLTNMSRSGHQADLLPAPRHHGELPGGEGAGHQAPRGQVAQHGGSQGYTVRQQSLQ